MKSWLRDVIIQMNAYYPQITSLESYAALNNKMKIEVLSSLNGFDGEYLLQQGNDEREYERIKEGEESYKRRKTIRVSPEMLNKKKPFSRLNKKELRERL